jgi:hypothetical protein
MSISAAAILTSAYRISVEGRRGRPSGLGSYSSFLTSVSLVEIFF